MRICAQLFIADTEHLRFELDRIEPYASQGGPISEAEKEATLAAMPTIAADVVEQRDAWNSSLPSSAEEKDMAYIEIHPLYQGASDGSGVLDVFMHMDDADLLAVPPEAVEQNANITDPMRDGYAARLASIVTRQTEAEASAILAKKKKGLPAAAQALIPAQVQLTVDS